MTDALIDNPDRPFRPTNTQSHFLLDIKSDIVLFMSAIQQGKSACLPAKAMFCGRMQHPSINGERIIEVLVIRGTQTQLLDTTVKAVREWLGEDLMKIRESQPIRGNIRGMPCYDADQHFPETMHYYDKFGNPVEGPYLLGARRREEDGLYVFQEGTIDVSGKHIGDIFPQGTTLTAEWRFMAADSKNWEGDLLSTNFSFCLIDEADKVVDLEKKLPVIAGRLGRAPSADIAPCTTKQICMCYNPPDEGTYLHRLGTEDAFEEGSGVKLYEMPPPIIRIENPKEPDCYQTCEYKPNPEAEGLHFSSQGAKYWLDLAKKFAGDPHYIERSLLGNYPPIGGMGKRVYPLFKTHKHVATVKPSHRLKLIIACDWGNTPCATFMQFDGGLRILDELYDDEMLSARFVRDELMPYINSEYGNYDIMITGDPTGSTVSGASFESLYDLFVMAGHETVENLTNEPELRWDAVNYYLAQENGFYIDPKCERSIQGFASGYIFDENAAKRGRRKAQKTGPNGKFSHIQDAIQAGALYFRGGWEYRSEQGVRLNRSGDQRATTRKQPFLVA